MNHSEKIISLQYIPLGISWTKNMDQYFISKVFTVTIKVNNFFYLEKNGIKIIYFSCFYKKK